MKVNGFGRATAIEEEEAHFFWSALTALLFSGPFRDLSSFWLLVGEALSRAATRELTGVRAWPETKSDALHAER